jgi:hypothetical protein
MRTYQIVWAVATTKRPYPWKQVFPSRMEATETAQQVMEREQDHPERYYVGYRVREVR